MEGVVSKMRVRFKYVWRVLLAVMCLAVTTALVVATSRIMIIGYFRGEEFAEDFLPLSYHIERLRDPDIRVRSDAVNQISQMRSKAGPATSSLVVLLRDPALGGTLTPDALQLRKVAIITLREMGPAAREAIPALMELLDDPDSGTRMEVMKALRSIGPDPRTAVLALAKTIEDDFRLVRVEAATMMRGLDRRALKRELSEAMSDKRPSVRIGVVQVIGELGVDGKDLAPVLRKACSDPNSNVANAARQSLARLERRPDDSKNHP
jgi:HEAT repeat protein